MPKVTVEKAQADLPKLIDKVIAGEEVIISRRREAVARLVPISGPHRRRKPGALKGRINIGPAFFEPLPEAELDAWGER